MSASKRADDHELEDLLGRRAARAKVDPTIVERVVRAAAAESRLRPRTRWAVGGPVGRARRTLGALVAAAAVVSLVGAALFVGAGQRAASPSPSSTTGRSIAESTGVRFTSVDFLRFLREQPDAFASHTVLVDGTLGDIMASCVRASFDCPPQAFGNAAGPADPLVLPADQAARDSIREGASGTFAIQVRSASDLRLLGRVQAPAAGDIWRPSVVAAHRPAGADLFAVDGYLGSAAGVRCPLVQLPWGQSWCPASWIADSSVATTSGGGGIPAGALRIPSDFASSHGTPALQPHVQVLLRSAPVTSCEADPGCAGTADGNLWSVVSTIDPVTIRVPSSPLPSNVADAVPTVLDAPSLPGVLPTLPTGSTVLVRGTLVHSADKACTGDDCPVAGFESIVDEVRVLAGGDMVTPPVSGTFAVRVVDGTHVRYVDTLVANGDHLSWRPLELSRYGPPDDTAFVVSGWLVPGDDPTCPPGPSGSAVCGRRPPQLVEDEATARTLLGGQKVESLLLADVADGVRGAAAGAEQGFFVVRASTKTCNDLGGQPIPDCFIPPNPGVDLVVDAELVADPLAAVRPPASPSSSPPSASTSGAWSAITVLPSVSEPFRANGTVYVMGAAARRDGFVAAGYEFGADQHVRGDVWLSPDGRSWGKTTPALLDGVSVDAVQVSGNAVLVHGVTGRTETERGQGRLFASDDGASWAEVTTPPLASDPEATIAAGPVGFVALTSDGSGISWRMFRSVDGRTWTEAQLPPQVQGGAVQLFGSSSLYGLGILEGSELHTAWPSVHDRHVEVAVSQDAQTWTTSSLPDATGVGGLFFGADGMIATGPTGYCFSCIRVPIAWRSGDRGTSWQPVSPALAFRDSLSAGDGEILMWSLDPRGQLYRVRASTDGAVWTEVPVFDARRASRTAVGGTVGPGGIVTFEQTPDHPAHQVAVFVAAGSPPPGATSPTAAPEPSDQPCVSPMPRDSDGACGP